MTLSPVDRAHQEVASAGPSLLEQLRCTPEEADLDPRQLERLTNHLEQRYVGPGKIAGCVTAVLRGDRLPLLDVRGHQDRERDIEMGADTIFRIYSMTKPITSVALMTLYEEGAFQLSDPVERFLPELGSRRVYVTGNHPLFQTVPVERSITIRDLLTHTSGLTYGFMERTNVDRAYRKLGVEGAQTKTTLADMVTKLGELPLEFSPGSAWNYSVATDVCGRLIEVLSGQSLAEFLGERIFHPLGMSSTGFAIPDDQLDRFATCYHRGPNKELVVQDDAHDSRYRKQPTFLSGGGGLVSSTADYLQFCRMLLGGGSLGKTRILGRKTLELMTMNHLPEGKDLTELATGSFSEVTYHGTGFGLGFSVIVDVAKSLTPGSAGEFGWGGMASTTFWVDPKEGLAVVFMVQFIPSGTFNFRGQLKQLLYPALR